MSLSKEDRLLLNCSKIILEEKDIVTAVELLQDPLDWGYIVESSIRHGVAPLLRNALKQMLPRLDQASQEFRNAVERLEMLYQTSRRRNQRLYHIIGDIVREFDRAGIPVMGLKDVQLAKFVYPDPALRPMGDIDLLIHQEDYERAAECMFRLGFEREPFDKIPYTLKYAWGHHFRRSSDNTYVDLQWNVMQIEWDVYREGSFDFEIERMWKNARQVSIDDFQILVPQLEDMLFHLCAHLDGHRYAELILLCDIHEILLQNRPNLNWEYFGQIVKKYNAEAFTFYPLMLIQQLFQVDLPMGNIASLRPPYVKADLIRNLFGNLTRLHHELDYIQQTVLPVPATLQDLEITIRHQTACAMKAYKEINWCIQAFMESGGSYLHLDSGPAERLFAESSLPAFGDFNLLVPADELPIFKEALLSNGFKPGRESDDKQLQKTVIFQSQDPILNKAPTQVSIECVEVTGWESILDSAHSPTTRQVALKLLKNKLKKEPSSPSAFNICLRIYPIHPDQIFMYLCHRIGCNASERLLELVYLLDFMETHPMVLQQWGQSKNLSGQAVHHASAGIGRSLVMDLLNPVDARLEPDATNDAPVHIFEWARLGPEAAETFARFKRPFNFFRSLLSIDTPKDKIGYFFQFSSGNHPIPLIAVALADMVSGVLQLLKKPSAPVLAYWVESESNSAFKSNS